MTYSISIRGRMGTVTVGAQDEGEAVAKALTMMAGGSEVVITDANGREVDFQTLQTAVSSQGSGNA